METKDQANQQGSQENQPEPMYKIKVQGVEKELPLSKMLELAQKGDDYELKMKAIKTDREKIEEEVLQKAEELNEQYISEFQQQVNQKDVETKQYENPQDKKIAELELEVAKMKKGTEDTKVAQYELQYEKKLAECKAKYPQMDERVVLALLTTNPDLDMEKIAKESHENKETERDKIIKEYIELKKKQPKELVGGGPSSQKIPEFKGKDLMSGNVKRAATEFLRQSTEQ